VFRNQHEGHLERGAAAVEMALVLPLLLLVLFGLIDFGRAFNAQMQLTQAAREGVRVVVVGGFTSSAAAKTAAETRAQLAMPGGGGSTSPTVTAITYCAAANSTTTPPTPATVTGSITVQSTFSFLTPLGPIAKLVGGGSSTLGDVKTLSATGVMRCLG